MNQACWAFPTHKTKIAKHGVVKILLFKLKYKDKALTKAVPCIKQPSLYIQR